MTVLKIVIPKTFVNPLTTNVPYHVETSQLICTANQLTVFFMTGTLVVLKSSKLLKSYLENQSRRRITYFPRNGTKFTVSQNLLCTLNMINET